MTGMPSTTDKTDKTETTETMTGAENVAVSAARNALDEHVREIVDWHFNPATGCPFWLEYASKLGWDPRREIKGVHDLQRLGPFEDEWLRGGPVNRWIPKGCAGDRKSVV